MSSRIFSASHPRPLLTCCRLALAAHGKQASFAPTRLVSDLKRQKLPCLFTAKRRTSLGRSCRAQKGADTNSSMLGNRTTQSLSVQRHALFNDFTLTIPFGSASIVAGVVSLAFKGGWTGVLTSLAGALMFTLGSMSHHNTYEGTDSSRSLTLTSAAIAALLARAYYFKAIAGVAGTMVMTIVSAVISLGLVYNVVAGGNKPRFGASADSPAPPSSRSQAQADTSQSLSDSISASRSFGRKAQSDAHAHGRQGTLQQQGNEQATILGPGSYPLGANAYTIVAVTGAVLYAQGLWGLWGESVGYSPVGLAAAAVSGLATLTVARAMLPQTSIDKTDSYRHSKE